MTVKIRWQDRRNRHRTSTLKFLNGMVGKKYGMIRDRRPYGRLKIESLVKNKVLNANGSAPGEDDICEEEWWVLTCSYRCPIGYYVDESLNFFHLLSRLWDHGEIRHTCASSLETDAPKNAMHSHFVSLNSWEAQVYLQSVSLACTKKCDAFALNSSEARIYLQFVSGLRSTAFRMCFVPPNSLETRIYLQLTSGPRMKARIDNCKYIFSP